MQEISVSAYVAGVLLVLRRFFVERFEIVHGLDEIGREIGVAEVPFGNEREVLENRRRSYGLGIDGLIEIVDIVGLTGGELAFVKSGEGVSG